MRESEDRMDGENEERVERMLRERKKRNGEGNTNWEDARKGEEITEKEEEGDKKDRLKQKKLR